MNALLFALVVYTPAMPVTSVAVIEHNTVVGSNLDQLIFWEASEGELRVRHWVMSRHATPVYIADGLYTTILESRHVVTAKSFRRTVTDIDPEVENRKLYPAHLRRKFIYRRL